MRRSIFSATAVAMPCALIVSSISFRAQLLRFSSSSPASSSPKGLLALNDRISHMIVDFHSKTDLCSRMITNAESGERPWEASCIEVERKKEQKNGSCAVKKSSQVDDDDDDPAGDVSVAVSDHSIVLYYETSTPEGLTAYRAIASRVALGQLPGETENRAAYGFALWRVSAEQFLILNAKPRLE